MNLRALASIMLSATLAACGEAPSPMGLAPASPSLTSGPDGRLPIVMVRRDAPPRAQGAVTSSVSVAMERVRPGGRIVIHAGTYPVQGLLVGKPLTIEAAGGEMPLLDAAGASEHFRIRNMAAGPIRIRGLAFRGATAQNIVVEGEVADVEISANSFYPPEGDRRRPVDQNFAAGVAVWHTSKGTVTVAGNRFDDGAVGVHGHGAHNLVVRGNSFRGQSNVAVQVGGTTTSTARIIGNEVSECEGVFKCVGIYDGFAEVIGNRFTIDISLPIGAPISGGGRRAVIRDNVILGTGGTRDPSDRNTWPMEAGIGLYRAADFVVEGNRISGGYSGIWFDQSSGTAANNVIDRVRTGIGTWAVDGVNVLSRSNVVFRRNDLTNYVEPLPSWSMEGFGSVDLTCNWWGTAGGPANLSSAIPSSIITPWASAPIAGTTNACP